MTSRSTIRRTIRIPRALGWDEHETKGQPAITKVGGERGTVCSFVPHRCQRWSQIPLREAAAVGVGDEWVMEVPGLGEAEQLLEQALYRG